MSLSALPGLGIILRPGATSRFGERETVREALSSALAEVIDLDTDGFVDGGDILITEHEVIVGESARTDVKGASALASTLSDVGIPLRRVRTPPEILHFKTACGLLDAETVFCTRALAETGCFAGYRLIECPIGEEAAANLVRINDIVLLSEGHPRTSRLLEAEGFTVAAVPTTQAAKLDGGLSCMSLRWHARSHVLNERRNEPKAPSASPSKNTVFFAGCGFVTWRPTLAKPLRLSPRRSGEPLPQGPGHGSDAVRPPSGH